jgi:hypothetical protein
MKIQFTDELESLTDEAFLRTAYALLLGRSPDLQTLRYGLARSGPQVSRRAFWNALAAGEESAWHVGSGSGDAEPTPSNPPASLEELLALNGEDFVQAAYQLMLQRAADDSGAARYLALLAQGHSKWFVLDAVFRSPEAQGKQPLLSDLPQRLRSYRKAQNRGWSGWYWREVRGIESDLPRDREIRAALNRLVIR